MSTHVSPAGRACAASSAPSTCSTSSTSTTRPAPCATWSPGRACPRRPSSGCWPPRGSGPGRPRRRDDLHLRAGAAALGAAGRPALAGVAEARAEMRSLVERCGETVNLYVRQRTERVSIAQEEGTAPCAAWSRSGSRCPCGPRRDRQGAALRARRPGRHPRGGRPRLRPTARLPARSRIGETAAAVRGQPRRARGRRCRPSPRRSAADGRPLVAARSAAHFPAPPSGSPATSRRSSPPRPPSAGSASAASRPFCEHPTTRDLLSRSPGAPASQRVGECRINRSPEGVRVLDLTNVLAGPSHATSSPCSAPRWSRSRCPARGPRPAARRRPGAQRARPGHLVPRAERRQEVGHAQPQDRRRAGRASSAGGRRRRAGRELPARRDGPAGLRLGGPAPRATRG